MADPYMEYQSDCSSSLQTLSCAVCCWLYSQAGSKNGCITFRHHAESDRQERKKYRPSLPVSHFSAVEFQTLPHISLPRTEQLTVAVTATCHLFPLLTFCCLPNRGRESFLLPEVDKFFHSLNISVGTERAQWNGGKVSYWELLPHAT